MLFKFKAFLIFSILVVLSACHISKSVTSDEITAEGLELRVMSFNIRYGTANDGSNNWENRKETVFDVLKKQNCDIVGLQEALQFQIGDILSAIPQYAMVGVGRDDGKTKGEYAAILYRHDRFELDEFGTFWLSDTPEVPGSITWGNACTRICTWTRLIDKKSGAAFYTYNLHLDHVSQPSREKSAALLVQRINSRKHKDPFIVTGDFNTAEDNPVILYLKGKAALDNPISMVDTFRVLHPDTKNVGTYHSFKGGREGDKIDYIFTTPDVKVLEAEILHDNVEGRYPSDHYPVTALLLLPNTRKN